MNERENSHRQVILSIAMGLVFALALGRAAYAAEKEASPYIGPAAAFKDQTTLQEKLKTKVDVNFEAVPLKDVARLLSEVTGTSVMLRERKLEEAAVSPDVLVTFHVRQTSLRSALRLILKDLELGFVECDNYLVITTSEDAETEMPVRVYDVRELLALPEPADGKRSSATSDQTLVPAVGAASTPGLAIPKSVLPQFGGATPPAVCLDPGTFSNSEELLGIITSTVANQTWDSVGGPASIKHYKGLFVVSQTSAVHEQVEHLLNMLHEAAGLPNKTVKVFR